MKRFKVGMTLEQVIEIIYADGSPWVSVPSESDTRFSVVHMFRNVAPALEFDKDILVAIYW